MTSITQVDHLVVAAESLEQGRAWCEATLFVTPGADQTLWLYDPGNLESVAAKLDQTGLLRVELQAKLGEAFLECFQTRLSLVVVLKPHHKVIRVPHNNNISHAAILPPPFNPSVEHVVQEHVRQER